MAPILLFLKMQMGSSKANPRFEDTQENIFKKTPKQGKRFAEDAGNDWFIINFWPQRETNVFKDWGEEYAKRGTNCRVGRIQKRGEGGGVCLCV